MDTPEMLAIHWHIIMAWSSAHSTMTMISQLQGTVLLVGKEPGGIIAAISPI